MLENGKPSSVRGPSSVWGATSAYFALNKLFKPNQMGLTASSISILARPNLRNF
jgi:hypothetical protein